MRLINYYDIIRKPLLTEKINSFKNLGKYSFVVEIKASKYYIKKAIESIFKVKVIKINTINVNGKVKIFKGKKGRRSRYKKAIITTSDKKALYFSEGI